MKALKGTAAKGMILPFAPMALTFDRVSYYVAFPKVLPTPSLRGWLSVTLHAEGGFGHATPACMRNAGISQALPALSLGQSEQSGNCYYAQEMADQKKEGGKDMLQLLNEVSGAFQPGILTALVGVSGAGKTTLMDVLAGRKTGEPCSTLNLTRQHPIVSVYAGRATLMRVWPRDRLAPDMPLPPALLCPHNARQL